MRAPISCSASPYQGTDENVRLVEGSPDAQTIPNLSYNTLQPLTPLFNSGLILGLWTFAAELLNCQDFREEPLDGKEALGPRERCLEGILFIEALVRTWFRAGDEYIRTGSAVSPPLAS